MNELMLDEAARLRLKKFHQDGLLWMVNTALLHPRGLALAVHLDDEGGEYLGLSVVGEGDEPWIFDDDQADLALTGYLVAEAAREEEWSASLQAGRAS